MTKKQKQNLIQGIKNDSKIVVEKRIILRDQDLSGLDLSGADLRDADLQRANLQEADHEMQVLRDGLNPLKRVNGISILRTAGKTDDEIKVSIPSNGSCLFQFKSKKNNKKKEIHHE